jgi:hypothetical protein
MPAKAQSAPDVSPDPKRDNGIVSPITSGEEANDTSIQSGRANPTGQNQGTLISWLKTYKDTGYLKTDTTPDIGVDVKRDLGTDTKRDMETGTKANSAVATNSASEQVFDFTFRAPTPLGGTFSVVKQPAPNQDVRPPFDFFKMAASSEPLTTTLPEAAHPVPLSSGTPQHHSASATPLVNSVISNPQAAPPSIRLPEAVLSKDFPDQNLHSDPSPVHGGEAAPRLSGTSDWNKATPGLLTEVETAKGPLQPEMPVRSIESDRTQSTNAIRVEKRGTRHPNTRQLLSPLPTAFVNYSSAPSTVPSAPLPKIRLRSPDAGEDDDDSRIRHSASPTGPNAAILSAGAQTPGSEEGDDFYSSSSPSKQEFDSEDDSFALARSSRSPSQDLESVSSAMVRSPSPGGLNVIWFMGSHRTKKEDVSSIFLDCARPTPRFDYTRDARGLHLCFQGQRPSRERLRENWSNPRLQTENENPQDLLWRV